MDVVAETGPEAIVRTLLQAMEHPNPISPIENCGARSEIQFSWGSPDLEIAIDYEPYCP